MYKIKMKCFDGNEPYEDEPAFNPANYKREDALTQAMKMAKDECEGLNETAEAGMLYFVMKDESNGLIHVMHPRRSANAGKALTTYYLEEITPPAEVTVFGFTQTQANSDRVAQEIASSSAVFISKEAAEEAAWETYNREFYFAREYGLLKPSEKKVRRNVFVRGLWDGTSSIKRTDLQVRFGGWSQILKIGG